MKDVDLEFIACDSAKEACEGADNYRCMHLHACKIHAIVIENECIKEGVHISGLGGLPW